MVMIPVVLDDSRYCLLRCLRGSSRREKQEKEEEEQGEWGPWPIAIATAIR